MKINFYIVAVAIATATISCNGCKTDQQCRGGNANHIATYTKPYKFNIIGLMGDTTGGNYIEVQYTIANGINSNTILTQFVKPPCIVGGQTVNVTYDSGYSCTDGHVAGISVLWDTNYTYGSCNYMKIINHGNKPIEYFIAGTQDTTTVDVTKLGISETHAQKMPYRRTVASVPLIQYKNAPIYYLLYPDKKPSTDMVDILINYNSCGNCEHFYGGSYNIITSLSNPNICGSLTITQPWKIEDVFKLYRAANNNSLDTTLTDWSASIKYIIEPNMKSIPLLANIYGIIQSRDSLQSSNKIQMITHYMLNIDNRGYSNVTY